MKQKAAPAKQIGSHPRAQGRGQPEQGTGCAFSSPMTTGSTPRAWRCCTRSRPNWPARMARSGPSRPRSSSRAWVIASAIPTPPWSPAWPNAAMPPRAAPPTACWRHWATSWARPPTGAVGRQPRQQCRRECHVFGHHRRRDGSRAAGPARDRAVAVPGPAHRGPCRPLRRRAHAWRRGDPPPAGSWRLVDGCRLPPVLQCELSAGPGRGGPGPARRTPGPAPGIALCRPALQRAERAPVHVDRGRVAAGAGARRNRCGRQHGGVRLGHADAGGPDLPRVLDRLAAALDDPLARAAE